MRKGFHAASARRFAARLANSLNCCIVLMIALAAAGQAAAQSPSEPGRVRVSTPEGELIQTAAGGYVSPNTPIIPPPLPAPVGGGTGPMEMPPMDPGMVGGMPGPGGFPGGGVPMFDPYGRPLPGTNPHPMMHLPPPPSFPCYWVNTEYFLWKIRSDRSPIPLITTGATATIGILGQPTTVALAGDERFEHDAFSGFRITAGAWMDPNYRIGLEGVGFTTERRQLSTFVASDPLGIPTFARPFFDANTQSPASLPVSIPVERSGSAAVVNDSQSFGFEGNLLVNLFRGRPDCKWSLTFNLLGGFRYFNLTESLNIATNSNVFDGAFQNFDGFLIAGPLTLFTEDNFFVRNQFYGGQLGFQSTLRNGRWAFLLNSKIALGVMHQELENYGVSAISGLTAVPARLPGGILVQSTNLGQFNQDSFSVIPEIQAGVGYYLTQNIYVFAAYNFIYVSDVVRPGNQIDPVVNPALVPTSLTYGTGVGPNRPSALLAETDFWLQGINFGINIRF